METSDLGKIKMSKMQMTKETAHSPIETFESVLNVSQNTEQESLTFVKKLLTIGLSSITYLRNVLPEGAYISKNMEGLELKILNHRTECPSAKLLVNYINACFETIEKKYLRRLTLNFEDSCVDPEKLVESFSFSFSYPETGEYLVDEMMSTNYSSVDYQNTFNVKKPTVKMLRTVILLSQALSPLPDNVQLSMELDYYYDVTPPNYEPRGFVPLRKSLKFEAETVKIKIGEVRTKYHTVDLKCKTTNLSETGDENSANDNELDRCDDTQSQDLQSQPLDEDIFGDIPNNNADSPLDKEAMIPNNNTTSGSFVASDCCFTIESVIKSLGEKDLLQMHENKDSENGIAQTPHQPILSTPHEGSAIIRTGSVGSAKSCSQGSESVSSEIEYPIRCPCGINFDQGIMILCDVCNFWQHGPCFNIISEHHTPARHICEKCADPPSICTDPRLTSTNLPLVSAACMYRRTLVILDELKNSIITPAVLMQYLGINEALASGIFMRTTREGITQQNVDSGVFSIDKDKLLKEAFPKYLRTPDDKISSLHVDKNISKLNITNIQESNLVKIPSGKQETNLSHVRGSLQGKRKHSSDNKENMMKKVSLPYLANEDIVYT